ncbi:MAG TPA: Zn-dependent hydrolase [Gammaproteobacteria bacterium]|nr:Zn-dependent hydrolase [Gammaproteobacteria bacterium]
MHLRQYFDPTSSTLTYLLADPARGVAVLIDPVLEHVEDYIRTLEQGGLRLTHSLETHVHADHVTAGGALRQRLGNLTAVGQACGATAADLQLEGGERLPCGDLTIEVISTPGHTPGSVSFRVQDRVFTGDALLIGGCGRTDFQGGDAGTLYDSITERLFTLPDETLVYPGHDYRGRRVSCIGEERSINPRLAGKSRAEFIALMQALALPKPRLIDLAVPANRRCGVPTIDDVPHG